MAVCKRCGCAIPIGSKSCDMCAVTASTAPAQQPWVAPVNAAVPAELASSAASWAGGYATRPGLQADLTKARKEVRSVARFFAVVGIASLGLGTLAEVGNFTAIQGYFNWFSAAEGGIFLLIAYFAWGGSVMAVIAGAGLYFLDTVALAFAGYFSLFRLAILAYLVRAVLAAYQLRQQPSAQRSDQDQGRAA